MATLTYGWLRTALAVALAAATGCTGQERPVLTFSGSAVGLEADIIRRQLDRFGRLHPEVTVALRATPDAADQRHQLYVQWLNARASDPDVLQLDVIWTPEFAAAGWIANLDRFAPVVDRFFPAAIAADRWKGSLFALPWFIDVGMLYWRTDLIDAPPRDIDDIVTLATRAQAEHALPFGFVWQGARYEGLVTVFLEHLGAFGGVILDADGRVAVDSAAAVRALTFMRDTLYTDAIVPPAVLTWREEQTRFAFQSGQALFMRNWPYAYALLQDEKESRVAGRFAVMAINANSDQPDAAYALIDFLLQPEQMIERAEVTGQYPTRPALYDTSALADALPIPPADALAVIERAVPRPVTPVYSQLSEILQISVHRALTEQQTPEDALRDAAAGMRALLARVALAPEAP